MGWSSRSFWNAVDRKHRVAEQNAASQAGLRSAQTDEIRQGMALAPGRNEADIGLQQAQAAQQRAQAGLQGTQAGLLPGRAQAEIGLNQANALQSLTSARGQSISNQALGSTVDFSRGTLDTPRAGLTAGNTQRLADRISGGAVRPGSRSRGTGLGMTSGQDRDRFGMGRRLQPR